MLALEDLLREREFEQISVTDIARRAGVAVGSVYSHFKDKDAFLAVLLSERTNMLEERITSPETRAAMAAAKNLSGLREAITLASRSCFAQIKQDAHIMRALLTYIRQHPEALETRDRLARLAFEGVLELIEAYRDEITNANLTDAVRMVNHFLNMIFLDKVLFVGHPNRNSAAPDDETLIQGVADMAYAYLTSPNNGAKEPGD